MIPIADAHCDYLYNAAVRGRRIGDGIMEANQVTLEGLKRGGVRLQVFAAWCGNRHANPKKLFLNECRAFSRMLADAKGAIRRFSASAAPDGDVIEAVLAVEGADLVESLDDVEFLRENGVKILTLTWNNNNRIGNCAMDSSKGLTDFGREVVRALCRSNIAVDVSHLSRVGFAEVASLVSGPFMASHSNAYAVHSNERNLDDEQIKILIEASGFIGIDFYPPHVGMDGSLKHIMRHIEHVLDLGGENVLGFGSDFEGIDTHPPELSGCQDFQLLPEAMYRRNYPEELIQKICYGNFRNFIIKFH